MIKEKKLNEIMEKLNLEANIAKKMIKLSLEGVLYDNREKLHNDILFNEEKLNNIEIKIDEKAVSFIARYQPEATHLRTIFTIIKINNDLERIGDLAVNISENFIKLNKINNDGIISKVKTMGEKTQEMVEKSLKSFYEKKETIAESIIEMDDEVDELEKKIIRKLVKNLKTKEKAEKNDFYYYRIAKNFERIADLATNICEDTIYMIRGSIIKHGKEKEDEK